MRIEGHRGGTRRFESARRRALIGTAIGFCLAVQTGAAEPRVETPTLTLTADQGSLLLTWKVAPGPALRRLVVRYRLDGPAPSSPDDGSPLFNVPVTPGATTYKVRHYHLIPERSYVYSAFGLDVTGAIVEQTTASGIPLAPSAPGTVTGLRRVDVPATPPSGPAGGGR